ncbi:KxYKxGKxW signal peptide domain-containing protein [Lacticaseibacillus paracasei]|uniref:KxYKxGKxW signal peptide domain-containing protein n=1 Tax=Lacticaseibacillus paracasei TaxID=1597 RepID=UPI002916B705|nr:KxYKxGKxW signal peptide domain-containing protein [Lacticaseibacillus paracasei]WNX22765.1 KxYKxGKxW signal peptide domain-containing protein [Lacticaseibacillus paracasei]
MSKNNSAKQFINENGKVRFRLYKSGKKWLIAGTATVSGLLGGMFIMPHGVQAASQPQIGKVIDKGEVLATKGSATIPASSTQASTATSESASTTDLNSGW